VSQRAAAPDPDEIAGRYQVVQKLGAGAFGTVYKAKDRILGRMVAIKTIRLEGLAAAGASLEELVNRFKREAQVSAQLKHPNIVTIYDIGEANGTSYLAMEFIDGVGLDRVIAAAGRLPLERAAMLGAQVADGLDFAHRHNVVHRDIKPANIMIEGGDRVKVTDFGIARVTDSVDNLTATGSLLGTPSYMSPEQARGASVDGRSDLFAVGCILYEMVAGKKAFRGESITGLIFKIITEEPPLLRELDPSLPEEYVRIVARALAKTPDARYQSGRELADDLLALTRAGSSPTLRQSEMATSPGSAAVPVLPTLNAPTLAGDSPTSVPAAPTFRTGPPAPPTTLMPPPAEPTRLVSQPPPPVPRATPKPPPLPPPASRAAAPVLAPPAAPARSRAGLLVGVGVLGLFLLAGLGAAVFFVLRSRSEPAAAVAPPTDTLPPATLAQAPVTTLPAPVESATPEPAATTSAAPPPGAAGSSRAASGRTAATGGGAGAAGASTSATAPPPVTAAPARDPVADMLDREPQVDGRAAGEAAAERYRSDRGSNAGGGYGTNRRFARREKVPSDVTPPEKRAVAVLLNVLQYQALHHQRTGRYGDFKQILPRQVATPTVIEHAGYRFDLTVEPNEFKVVATPQAGGLRGFVTDESGFIRYADE
jgi:serine/threonine-protein kinase